MRRQQFALNDISSETTMPRVLIFEMKHCLVGLYRVCSNGASGIQNDSVAGILGSKIKYTEKFCSPDLQASGA